MSITLIMVLAEMECILLGYCIGVYNSKLSNKAFYTFGISAIVLVFVITFTNHHLDLMLRVLHIH